LAEIGQPLDAPMIIPTDEMLEYLARSLDMSIMTVVYEEDTPLNPSVKVQPVRIGKTWANVLLIFSLDDGSVGIVSDSSEEFTPIPFARMSVTQQVKIAKAPNKITL
jgi:hypothetical protein